MKTKIVIYDPPMCCSTGVCGPNPDPTLISLQDTLEKVKKMDVAVERYLITQSPKEFRENPEVLKLIQEQQLKALPITICNGEIIKIGAYPTLEELQTIINAANL